MLRISSADTIEVEMVADMLTLQLDSTKIKSEKEDVCEGETEDLLGWLYDYALRA